MPAAKTTSPTEPFARLAVPRRSLVSCVPAYLIRSTLGTAGAGLNHYPASPMCSVNWQLHGSTALFDNGGIVEDLVSHAGDAVFGGPQSRPFTTCNPGPVHFFAVAFYPDALHALTGIDISDWVDRFAPAEQVLDASWRELTTALMAAPGDDARIALVDDFLTPRWQAVRGDARSERGVLGDWVRRLAVQVAASGAGRGVRMAERRTRVQAGLPMRMLQRMGRAEQALAVAREEAAAGRICWAEVAAGAGYADQSHFTRESRAMSGLPPGELARAVMQDEAYWPYRIWR